MPPNSDPPRSSVDAINSVFENKFDELKKLSVEQLKESDNQGRTAVHAACFKGNQQMLEYMIEQFGDEAREICDIQDNNGKTAAHYACGSDWE